MPAGFNKGQVEYIKSVANVNAHKTYKPIVFPSSPNYAANHLTKTIGTHGRAFWAVLTTQPYVAIAGADTFATQTEFYQLNALNIPMWTPPDVTGQTLLNAGLDNGSIDDADRNAIASVLNTSLNAAAYQISPKDKRVGSEGFLESTHLKLRVVLNTQTNGDLSSDHTECRLVVFRARDKQHTDKTLSKTHLNPKYDLFHGIANYKVGVDGHRQTLDTEGADNYVAYSASPYMYSADEAAVMTLPINKQDYVVMKDHRFFLGKEYGGKNIYETTLHWDWNDAFATVHDDLAHTDTNEKNYCWYIMLFANNNTYSGTNYPELNVSITGTTHCTSG
jgi:hypothetical protein